MLGAVSDDRATFATWLSPSSDHPPVGCLSNLRVSNSTFQSASFLFFTLYGPPPQLCPRGAAHCSDHLDGIAPPSLSIFSWLEHEPWLSTSSPFLSPLPSVHLSVSSSCHHCRRRRSLFS